MKNQCLLPNLLPCTKNWTSKICWKSSVFKIFSSKVYQKLRNRTAFCSFTFMVTAKKVIKASRCYVKNRKLETNGYLWITQKNLGFLLSFAEKQIKKMCEHNLNLVGEKRAPSWNVSKTEAIWHFGAVNLDMNHSHYNNCCQSNWN